MRLLFCCCLLATLLPAQTLTPVWLELGPDGAVLARTVIDTASECPTLTADAKKLSMKIRQPVPEGMKPACEALVPAQTRSLHWGRRKLRIPKTPDTVAVIGDTGCRIKGGQIQACNDPNLWPFEQVAERVAKLKPDLIVHVGDYLYRETVCPDMVHGCGGPYGYSWEAWNADFFHPARRALAAAPWVFARGNHEACQRASLGWFYYLDPRPFNSACQTYTDPYIAQSGRLRMGVLDTGSTIEIGPPHPEQIPEYAGQLRRLSGRAEWIVDHHPFWGYTSTITSPALPTEMTLGPAWREAQPEGIKLVLSGHVHLFEFLVMDGGRPNQLIAGDSGTQLDTGFMLNLSKSKGAAVRAGEANLSFGFTVLQRDGSGWTLTLRDARGVGTIECRLPADSTASCHALRP